MTHSTSVMQLDAIPLSCLTIKNNLLCRDWKFCVVVEIKMYETSNKFISFVECIIMLLMHDIYILLSA